MGCPLWMTPLGHDSLADVLGGGGDIWNDSLQPEWLQDFGYEIEEWSLQELRHLDYRVIALGKGTDE